MTPPRRIATELVSFAGEGAAATALCCTLIASPDDRAILRVAFGAALVAFACAVVMFVRGGLARWLALLVGAISICVAVDAVRCELRG
jgi:hypothetical protein